jgi:hypothetical protein
MSNYPTHSRKHKIIHIELGLDDAEDVDCVGGGELDVHTAGGVGGDGEDLGERIECRAKAVELELVAAAELKER